MAEVVDVAVIGGGIAGASVAYFLAQEGVRNVLVLERTAVAAGASGRASGLVAFLAASHAGHAALLKASAELYDDWETCIGGAPAINAVGAVLPVPAAERAELEREVAIMRAAGHDTRIVERAELSSLVPDWDLQGIDAAAYAPGSGFIDPPMVTTALMNRARGLGVRVYHGATVNGIRVQHGKVLGVDTDRGRVDTDRVVIAAGAWSDGVARLAGARLDVWPVRHQVMHLKPPAGLIWPFPGCADMQNHVYFRPEHGGLFLAANAGPDDYPNEPPGDPDTFDPAASPWYGQWVLTHVARRIPAMRDAEIVGGHAGVYPKGRDGFPLVGPLPAAEGLFCACDTAGNGMTSSPGLGRALAELIVRGATFTDLTPFRPSRFDDGQPITSGYRHSATVAGPSWSV